jgi:hypothetical protein
VAKTLLTIDPDHAKSSLGEHMILAQIFERKEIGMNVWVRIASFMDVSEHWNIGMEYCCCPIVGCRV